MNAARKDLYANSRNVFSGFIKKASDGLQSGQTAAAAQAVLVHRSFLTLQRSLDTWLGIHVHAHCQIDDDSVSTHYLIGLPPDVCDSCRPTVHAAGAALQEVLTCVGL